MGTWSVSKKWFMLLLLVVFEAGCGQERGTLPPTLTSIALNGGVQGQTRSVTLTGTNFATGAAVNVGGALISATNTTVASTTQITATFAIAANAALGAANISVTTSGLTTNTVPFTIRAPALTSIVPNGGVQGQTAGVTLTGTDFATGATVNVGGTLITVTNTTVVSSTQIAATFAIAANAALGATNISVTTSGVTTNTVPFTIRPALAVVSTIPANAIGVALNTRVSVTFNLAMNCSTLTTSTFVVSTIGVPVAGSISACAGATATFTPTSNLAPDAFYSATITTGAKDLAGDGLSIPYVWSFSTVILPQVITTVPLNGATGVPFNQKITATFSVAMNPATLISPATNFTLTTIVGGVVTAVPGTVSYVSAGSTATFTPTLPLSPTTKYTATITTGAQDTNQPPNGLLTNYQWSFLTGAAPDVTAPFIISTIPANNATAVPVNQAVSATFSEAMDPATITGTTFTLTGPGGGSVAGTVTYAAIAKTATFTPSSLLTNGALYTATVTNGAKDLAGNMLGVGPVPDPWTFTTAPVPNIVNPTIVSTTPANASTNIAVNATVNATFDKAMNPLTISTITFKLADPSGVVINGTVAYDAVNFIATFLPSSNLAANTTYTATVTTGAQDLSGNSLGPGVVPNPWTFTTAAVTVPSPVPLGTASTFGTFGGTAGMTNQGTSTVINGNIGTTASSASVTGFHDNQTQYIQFSAGCIYTETGSNVGSVIGEIFTDPPPPTTLTCPNEGTAATALIAKQAAADALTAYNFISPASMFCTDFCSYTGELGGLTLAPGIYQSAPGTFGITSGDLKLDAAGDPNAVWVFQMNAALTVGIAGPTGARSVKLLHGAQAKNVFWYVGSAATINGAGGGTMVGTIISYSGVTFSTAGVAAITDLEGRALSLVGSVTMDNTTINVPAP